uniref:Uncharacterized protein n=1 Tax=Pseudonaja textilis TaxID=8673 RepID=A0A670YL32_PSETE
MAASYRDGPGQEKYRLLVVGGRVGKSELTMQQCQFCHSSLGALLC